MSGDYWDDPAVKKAEQEYERAKAEQEREQANAEKRRETAERVAKMARKLSALKERTLKKWERELEKNPSPELAHKIKWARSHM